MLLVSSSTCHLLCSNAPSYVRTPTHIGFSTTTMHDWHYLGMTFDYSCVNEVRINMRDYLRRS